jgi:hypothetical protein
MDDGRKGLQPRHHIAPEIVVEHEAGNEEKSHDGTYARDVPNFKLRYPAVT